MTFVSVRDFRGKSSEIWRRVGVEKYLVVTSNGHPIAILSAVSEDSLEASLVAIRQARASRAVESMQRASAASGHDRLSPAEIDAEIRAVRRTREFFRIRRTGRRGGAVWDASGRSFESR